MADSNDMEPPTGAPQPRRRAPTITIDTTAVSPTTGTVVDMPQDSAQEQETFSSPTQTSPQDDAISPSTLIEPYHSAGSSQRQPELRTETSFESRESRPTSPHNVSSPVHAKGHERGNSFLAVPNTLRSRQNSVDSDEGSKSVSSHGDTTVVASSSTQAEKYKSSTLRNDKIMKDPSALVPDAGTEGDFEVADNVFAYTPGQLGKMFNPKSLAAFYALGGLRGLEKGLRSDRKAGLSPDETTLQGQIAFEDVAGKNSKFLAEESTSRVLSKSDAPKGPETSGENFADRKRIFKDNRLPAKKGKSLWKLMWITYNDKVLMLLTAAAVVSLAVGLYQTLGVKHEPGEPKVEWVEGVAIIVAIAIVVIVGSLNDFQKERQFAKLNKKKQDRNVRVIRSGKTMELSVFDILVGEVVHLEPGDLVPVDGVLIDGFNVKCDESQATGESDIIRKRPSDEVFEAIENHDDLKKMDPFIQSGARIMEGVGTFMATSTGVHSSYGKTLMALNEDPEMTPLQAKLNVIATYIAKLGGAAALLLFIVLFIQFLVRLPGQDDLDSTQKGQNFLNIFIVVVTIIVVAVPEGLPLAVTLALAFATTRMLRDHNLVRHLKACEVMGNATTICSDKTGTLTQNKMQIVSATLGTSHRFGGAKPGSVEDDEDGGLDQSGDITPSEFTSMLAAPIRDLLLKSIALNSTAFEGDVEGVKTFIGSKTETALLLFAQAHLGMGPVQEIRESVQTVQLIPFDSGRKCMGIVVTRPNGGARLYIKGASEIVLGQCTHILRDPSSDDSVTGLTAENKDTINRLIESYAKRSLRTIGLAYRDFEAWPPASLRKGEGSKSEVEFEDLGRDLSFIGVVGIQDPLRDGVFDAVKVCQHAGVVVRMVTGDNKITATAIAKECGILQPDSIIMEGPEFRNLSKLQQQEIIPRLHVLARSSPDDKRVLVRRLKEKNETVAVTGDGTNDAPALKLADVGFSMGIAGTEVAKEASAIILMDDNFTSIVKALMWGRAVNDAVKRFLQFQLTVNVTAVVLTFITAVSSDSETAVLTAVQLLWVNLIMDTLAALALATDPPTESILDRKPEPKGSNMISVTMWKMIMGQALFQLGITLLLYYGAPHGILPISTENPPPQGQIETLVFNIFEGLTKNWFFMAISAIMIGGQILIIFVGSDAFQIYEGKLTGEMWAISIVLGILSLPVGVIVRLIPDSFIIMLIPEFLKRRSRKLPGLAVTDEEMDMYPEPLVDVRDELNFLRRMKGGRLNNLKFAIQHPKEVLMNRSPSHSRSNSLLAPPQTPPEVEAPTPAGTPDERKRSRSRSTRSRSNSALGAPTVMAGLVAAGIAAGWSPISREPSQDRDGGEMGMTRVSTPSGKDREHEGESK